MHEPPRAQLKLSHGIRRFQTALCGLQWIQASSRCVWLWVVATQRPFPDGERATAA